VLPTTWLQRMASRAPAIVQRMARHAPPIVQRLASAALSRLEQRWPTLATLLGRTPYVEPVTGAGHVDASPPTDGRPTAELIAALRDPTAEVAIQAVAALRLHPGEATVTALLGVLTNRDGYFSMAARAAAVQALGSLLPHGALSPLYAAVADVDAGVSLAAIAAIVERSEDGCAEALLTLLEDRRGYYLPPTRQAAARGLDRIRGADPSRVRALLANESDSVVHEALASVALPS